MWVLAGVAAAGLILISFKILFGNYSREYEKQKKIETTYNEMHKSRDAFCYHIAAARQRGETEDARRLTKELKSLDLMIDDFEVKNYGRPRRE